MFSMVYRKFLTHLSPFRLSVLTAVTFALPASMAGQSNTSNSAGTDCTSSLFNSTGACNAQSSTPGSSLPNIMQSATSSQEPAQADNAPVYVDSAGNVQRRNTSTDDMTPSHFPPDPVTDFQKLARSSTGEILPLFGRNFFQQAPSTFAPADQIPAASDYVVGPGDVVLVRLWGATAQSSNNQLTVDSSGNIYIPKVGAVRVAGLRMDALQGEVSSAVDHVFRNYQIAVSLGRLRSIQVYVVGEARRPGAYTISALSTVLNALFVSGGPSIAGSMRRIQVRRGRETISTLDLYDLVLKGDKSHDIRLESGDTIFIPAVGPQVALAGSIHHPAIYEMNDSKLSGSDGDSLQDLLTLAGGFSSTASTKDIRVERIDSDFQRHALTIALDDASRSMPLHDGDILYANHIGYGFDKSVTIRGNLANPGRFAWKPGMRLSDIIPDRASLLTGDYWRERNRMGAPTPLFEPYEFDKRPPAQGAGVDSTLYRSSEKTQGPASLRNALTSVQPPRISDAEPDQATLAASGVVSSSALNMDQQATNATNNLDETNNTGTGNLNSNSRISQAQQEGLDTQSEEGLTLSQSTRRSTGTTTTAENNSDPQQQHRQSMVLATTDGTSIRLPAPEIDWSYAVIERVNPKTLKSSLIPFNLGKLVLDHDADQNLEIQDGDVITILNQRDIMVPQDERTKYVRLEGEFAAAGVYSVKPGETLEQLVVRAGGFTSNAYLYGSSFLRESARLLQQQRLDEYITQLSTDMDRQTAVSGASSNTGTSDPNALMLERNLVAQLRSLRATGRIVLEFSPDSSGISSIPRIPLENGDVFRVPSRPDTINVIGAMYGQNIFLFNPKRHLEDYMALAGGPNRVADKSHAFIIRADGSVYSHERAKSIMSNHFDDARVFPGDTIVMPEKLIKPTLTRQLIDYSSILSGFGLAAAAIEVIQ